MLFEFWRHWEDIETHVFSSYFYSIFNINILCLQINQEFELIYSAETGPRLLTKWVHHFRPKIIQAGLKENMGNSETLGEYT